MQRNSKIYVAGHTGLVGSALVKALKNKGYTNIIGKTIEELDLRNTQSVKTFFEGAKPEYVILAAAKVGGIIANNTYRAEFIFDNLMIQNNIIDQAYRNGVKKLLFLGSTCIYPRESPQPMQEDALLTSPLEYSNEPYAIAKIAGIKVCESYNLQYGTNFISVMPTNLYGPNDNFDLEKSHVLPALIRKVHLGKCLEQNNWEAVRDDLNKRPVEGVDGKAEEADILEKLKAYGITKPPQHPNTPAHNDTVRVEIWGSGKPMREFLWSEEMAAACVYVMENVDFIDLVKLSIVPSASGLAENCTTIEEFKARKTEIRNTHINIGTGKEISIKQLAELVKKQVGFKGELYFNTEKPDGTMRKLTDVGKLHNLGWHHKIDIEEGVEKMYKWYVS
ncbi:MAG: GDP-L-fucose synthase [Bacteroidales bacterium]|nr:GDP-L-fucose synthase [Bacteroidales bacterium]